MNRKNYFESKLKSVSNVFARIRKGKRPINFPKQTSLKNPHVVRQKPRRQYFLRLPIQDQVLFAKRLAVLHKAGIPILTALQMLKKQARTKAGTKIIGHLHTQVENGQYLSTSMSDYKKVFGEFAVNIVRVGEISGTLSENLGYLAEELKKKQELKRKIISALVYPTLIVFATIGITVLLVAYVFPKILPIFQSFKSQLPWTTRFLILVSTGLQEHWLYISVSLIILIVVVPLLLRLQRVRLLFDRNIIRLPLLGQLFQNYQIINFTRTLGLLLKSEVPIVEALHIVADTSGNMAFRKAFNSLADKTTKGEKISAAMEKDTILFPPIVSQMVAVGETTGNLSESLLYLAEMFEDELNNLTRNLTTSIEPVLMIFMGILVGFIAISIIAPIYGITQNLHP